MKVVIDINKNNWKKFACWTLYLLFFLFNVTLITESYNEYEQKAANIFIVVTSIIGLFGVAAFFIQKSKGKKVEGPGEIKG